MGFDGFGHGDGPKLCKKHGTAVARLAFLWSVPSAGETCVSLVRPLRPPDVPPRATTLDAPCGDVRPGHLVRARSTAPTGDQLSATLRVLARVGLTEGLMASEPFCLRIAVLLAALAPSAACGSSPDADAAPVNCERNYYEQELGLIPEDGGCVGCGFGVEGDPACASAYPDVPNECVAVCKDSLCEAHCPGQGCYPPDGGACEPGEQACTQQSGDYALLNVCDSACPPAGGCRHCYLDDECQQELGSTAICERHCGTCCRTEDNYDGPFPCLCI